METNSQDSLHPEKDTGKLCVMGCGRGWDEEGEFKDCVSAYHAPEAKTEAWEGEFMDKFDGLNYMTMPDGKSGAIVVIVELTNYIRSLLKSERERLAEGVLGLGKDLTNCTCGITHVACSGHGYNQALVDAAEVIGKP